MAHSCGLCGCRWDGLERIYMAWLERYHVVMAERSWQELIHLRRESRQANIQMDGEGSAEWKDG